MRKSLATLVLVAAPLAAAVLAQAADARLGEIEVVSHTSAGEIEVVDAPAR